MNVDEVRQAIFRELQTALVHRVEFQFNQSTALSFRSFTYLLDIEQLELVKGQSWNQKVIVKNAPTEVSEEEWALIESKVIFVYVYAENQPVLPVLRSNVVHVRLPVDDERKISDAVESVLRIVPNDTVSFTASYSVNSMDFQDKLLQWMVFEEANFASQTGRTLLRKLYPESSLLKP